MTTYVVSDLHLDPARPEIAAQFHAFLAGPARHAEALYVLGDVFEAWIGDDAHAHSDTIAALRGTTDAGVALHFMHGNRDFLLGEEFCRAAGGSLLTDPTVVEAHGQRALLTHGDALCTDDTPYQRLRALVRDPVWQNQFLALSLAQREALASEARAGSREHTSTQQKMLMDVNPDAVARVFRDAGVDVIVHGHTHRPGVYRHDVEGRERRRIVTGDWHAQGSVLRWDARGFELLTLPRGDTALGAELQAGG
jgi:UDP-2,3-diacylglucosamine hydrolase